MAEITKGLVPRVPPRMFKMMPPKQRKRLMNTIVMLGENGFHARTIARLEGIRTSQVYAVCAAFGIKLRAYRDGRTGAALKIIRRAPLLAIKQVDLEQVLLEPFTD